jgi:hypothetical protein
MMSNSSVYHSNNGFSPSATQNNFNIMSGPLSTEFGRMSFVSKHKRFETSLMTKAKNDIESASLYQKKQSQSFLKNKN